MSDHTVKIGLLHCADARVERGPGWAAVEVQGTDALADLLTRCVDRVEGDPEAGEPRALLAELLGALGVEVEVLPDRDEGPDSIAQAEAREARAESGLQS